MAVSRLRRGVTFSDGTPLTVESAAAALRIANPTWRIATRCGKPSSCRLMLRTETSGGTALVRNSVVRREGGKLAVRGRLGDARQPGRKLTITAREDYWNGRPFLGSVEVDWKSDPRSPTINWSSYQLAEMAPEQARGATRTD